MTSESDLPSALTVCQLWRTWRAGRRRARRPSSWGTGRSSWRGRRAESRALQQRQAQSPARWGRRTPRRGPCSPSSPRRQPPPALWRGARGWPVSPRSTMTPPLRGDCHLIIQKSLKPSLQYQHVVMKLTIRITSFKCHIHTLAIGFPLHYSGRVSSGKRRVHRVGLHQLLLTSGTVPIISMIRNIPIKQQHFSSVPANLNLTITHLSKYL